MWRRISSHLQIVSSFRTTQKPNFTKPTNRRLINSSVSSSSATKISPFQTTSPLFSQHPTTDSDDILSKGKKTVEDVMPIATGHEREEIEAELQGRNLQEMDYPEGPFGTKEAPAIVKSTYDKRIVGCPGGEDEDEHDVVWFWLEKGKPHECPVCSQYFVLEVVGPGGSPDGHDDHDHHAHH